MATMFKEEKPKKPRVKSNLMPKQQKEKKLQEALRQNLLRRKASDDITK